MTGAQAAWLPDGRRLHLHHGPIDLVVDAEGPGRQAALTAAARRFATVLEELVPELPRLRAASGPAPRGAIAQAMTSATSGYGDTFITPMAAVAGAVADTILAAMRGAGELTRAYVNNGGDIALHLTPCRIHKSLLATDPPTPIRIPHTAPVRGIATSGWSGRSHSLGIADAVTVLARSAAEADAAATLIANAIDLPGHPAITRIPARDLAPDSDLGAQPVTTAVGPLAEPEIARALAAGTRFAETLLAQGRIHAAFLVLKGRTVHAGPTHALQHETEHA